MSSPDGRVAPAPSWPRHTERLVLRPAREPDLDRLLEFRNAPQTTRWLLRTVVDPAAYRAAWLAADDPFDHSVVVELDGVVVGTASLEVVDAMGQHASGPWQRSEGHLGYTFDPAVAGRGYATEVAAALLAVAFDDLGLHRVTAGCFADNIASWRVLEKVGMRREQHGIQDSWHAELGWVDGFTYAVLAHEWAAHRG